jgi:polyribonucleotide nucleotidyltransferase
MNTSEEIQIGGKSLSISAGQVAKQADGAVTVRYGDTVVLVTACGQREAREGVDFLPLTVDYREYTFSAGKIPGGFFRREGRPSENETLVSRMIDRPLRPLFPSGYNQETQVIASVLSYDLVHKPDILGVIGASAALTISPIPFTTPLGAVRIGRVNDRFVVNPTHEDIEVSTLDLVAVCSEDAVLMVEAGAREVSEEVVLEALELAWKEAQPIVEMQKKLAAAVGVEKWKFEPVQVPQEVQQKVLEKLGDEMIKTLSLPEKKKRGLAFDELRNSIIEEFPEEGEERALAKMAFDNIKQEVFRKEVFARRARFEGRAFDEVRSVSCDVPFLPRTHGSSLFTRGETQALVATTLGARSDAQIMDELEGEWKRRFMLHYNFPPFSVGEVKFLRGASRREIGHGALALRALEPVLPSEEDFPYTIRLVSDILESNGSSSMATVCGGSLALFDCGVPMRASVAGIAMGLLKEGDDVIILSDIAGEEDHYGDMDFKVAGTRGGITALQMDIKIPGVTTEILRTALEQAKKGRLFILDIMDATIVQPRPDLSPYAPRIVTLKIDVDKIRDVIGSGGKVIRRIVEESKAEIDIEDDGTVLIYSPDKEALDKAKRMIEEIVEEPEVGKTYVGKVVSIVDFGAFVQILPSVQGLLHISEIANYRVNQVSDELQIGDEVMVKVIEYDKVNGKVRLSRRAALEGKDGGGPRPSGGGSGPRHSGGGGYGSDRSSRPRGRRGPQHGGAPVGSRTGNDSGSMGKRRSSRSGPGYGGSRQGSDHDPSKGFRFPGKLGPDPHDPGGLGGPGGRKRW